MKSFIKRIMDNKRNRFLTYLAVSLIVLSLGLFVWAKFTLAATATWTNGGLDGKWSTCANWSEGTGTGGCPGTADIEDSNATPTAVTADTQPMVEGIPAGLLMRVFVILR